MFNWKKEITQEIIEQPREKIILLTTEEFHDLIIRYESGNLDSEDVLILFCYVIENEKHERCRYDWLIELMEYGVLTEDATVNPYKLKQYKNSKIKTKINF